MYRKIKRTPTSLNVNETIEGETIEKMIERRLNNGDIFGSSDKCVVFLMHR